jgi:hypothetical protein
MLLLFEAVFCVEEFCTAALSLTLSRKREREQSSLKPALECTYHSNYGTIPPHPR